jgi:hypothetical protein
MLASKTVGFPENIKLEAKTRAHYQCVICRQLGVFVEVHHIIPESENGPDTVENAAPLCPSCHETYGGNPDKRKWVRENRDFWWDFCEKKNLNPALVELNKKVEAVQEQVESNYASHAEAKQALAEYHGRSGYDIQLATDFSGLSGVTGISLPVSLLECPKCRGSMTPSREEKSADGNFVRWYRCDRCSHELPGLRGYTIPSEPSR